MTKLSELVETLQEELEDTKNQLSSLEEEHELLENSFEMYKEEMKNTVTEMYRNMQDLYRSMENIHREIMPAVRGKSYGGSSIEYNPSRSAKLDYRVERVYDPNTNTYTDRKVPIPWMEW